MNKIKSSGKNLCCMHRTSKPEYAPFILKALSNVSRATLDELMRETLFLVKDRLYVQDFKVLPNGFPRWRNQAEHMLNGLLEDNYIKKDSSGYSLTAKGKEYLGK